MTLSGVLGQQNLQRLELRFRPGYELYATIPSSLEIELCNQRRWLPAFLLRLEISGEIMFFPLLAAGHKLPQRLLLSMPMRGTQPFPPDRVTSCFPINFFIRSRTLHTTQQLLVFPCPLKSALPTGEGVGKQTRQNELPVPGSDGEMRSIDDYRPGDPLKSIHWKLSARHAGFKSKRQTRLGSPALQLDLQALPGSFEERLRRCTYLINYSCRQNRPVGLRLDNKRFPAALGSSHRLKLLAELARYDQR